MDKKLPISTTYSPYRYDPSDHQMVKWHLMRAFFCNLKLQVIWPDTTTS